jgi:hypothetical protein
MAGLIVGNGMQEDMCELATVVHKAEHNIELLASKTDDVVREIAAEDAAAAVVAGLDYDTFKKAGDDLKRGQVGCCLFPLASSGARSAHMHASRRTAVSDTDKGGGMVAG